MDLAVITATQVFELFVLIGCGALLEKTGTVDRAGKELLSRLLIRFVVPCMIVSSYLGGSAPALGSMTLWSMLALGVGLAAAVAGTRRMRKSRDCGIIRFALTFSNAAYMGFPLIQALYGAEGVLYASMYVTIFNLMIWTIGIAFVAPGATPRDMVRGIVSCPPIIAVAIGLLVFFLHVPVPRVARDVLGMVSAMNTPLSMIITGLALVAYPFSSFFRNRTVWFVVLGRMVAIPALSFAVLRLTGAHGMTAVIVLLLESCPCAAITTLFAISYRHDERLAVGSVVLSMFFSILTLPAVAFLASGMVGA